MRPFKIRRHHIVYAIQANRAVVSLMMIFSVGLLGLYFCGAADLLGLAIAIGINVFLLAILFLISLRKAMGESQRARP